MTPLTVTPDVRAAWSVYEALNARANGAYEALALFPCRNACGQDFGSKGSRQFHERGCGK